MVVKLLTAYLLMRYSINSQARRHVKVLTFLGWFLGLATIALLPLDIALANQQGGINTAGAG